MDVRHRIWWARAVLGETYRSGFLKGIAMARRSVLLVLALLLIASMLPGPGPGTAAGAALYPDLKTTKPSGLYFDRVTMSDGLSHFVLRFSNTVWNAGEGRLELQGDPNPSGNNKIYQNIYDGTTDGTRVIQRQVSSDIIYHPSHYHYHFEGFASYQLMNRDSSGVYQTNHQERHQNRLLHHGCGADYNYGTFMGQI